MTARLVTASCALRYEGARGTAFGNLLPLALATVHPLISPAMRCRRVTLSLTLLLACSDSGDERPDAGASGGGDGRGSAAASAAGTSGSRAAAGSRAPAGVGASAGSQSNSGGAAGSVSTAGSGAIGRDGGPGVTDSCTPVAFALELLTTGRRPDFDSCDELGDYGVSLSGDGHGLGFVLPEPLVAGQPYAIGFEVRDSTTRGGFELWGSDSLCGAASELLWWDEMRAGAQCASFTPSAAHASVLLVSRRLDVLKGVFVYGPSAIRFCPGGRCTVADVGHGAGPGRALEPPPLGIYQASGDSFYRGQDYRPGTQGRIVMLFEKGASSKPPRTITGGVLRLDPSEPFGDGWYCIGAGSTIARRESDDVSDLALRAISKLPACGAGAGGDVSVTIDSVSREAIATSSFAQLAGTFASYTTCRGKRCWLRLLDAPGGRQSYVDVELAQEVGSTVMPMVTAADVVAATWFRAEDASGVLHASCASAGTMQFGAMGATALALSNMSDFASCPGEPAAREAIELTIDH